MMRPIFFAVLANALLLFPFSAIAATIHVPGDQQTIQDGIDAAMSGDTVLVAPGIYFENIYVSNKGISLQSETGPEGTIIDGGLARTVIHFEDSATSD